MVIRADDLQLFDVVGGCVRFLAGPADSHSDQAFLQGSLPAGAMVPLHRHADPESFYVLSGEMELFCDDGVDAGWRTVRAGELAVIPGGAKHAWWNRGTAVCDALVTTGAEVYGFFQEIAVPLPDGSFPGPPTPARLAAVAEAAGRHASMWMGTPEENAAIGLPVPPPA